MYFSEFICIYLFWPFAEVASLHRGHQMKENRLESQIGSKNLRQHNKHLTNLSLQMCLSGNSRSHEAENYIGTKWNTRYVCLHLVTFCTFAFFCERHTGEKAVSLLSATPAAKHGKGTEKCFQVNLIDRVRILVCFGAKNLLMSFFPLLLWRVGVGGNNGSFVFSD